MNDMTRQKMLRDTTDDSRNARRRAQYKYVKFFRYSCGGEHQSKEKTEDTNCVNKIINCLKVLLEDKLLMYVLQLE